MRGSLYRSETAVSESIGFILVSGILIISFGIIFAIGYPLYNSYIDGGHMNNIQQSFNILAFNANSIALQKSPFSTSEIKMYGGTLTTREAGYINISYTDVSHKLYFNNTTLTMLEYSKGPEKMAYIEGSVSRLGPTGSMMMKDPEIYNSTDTLIIPLITLLDSNLTVAGNGPVQISFLTPYYSKMAKTVASPAMAYFPGIEKIDITVSSEYSHAFSDYFNRLDFSVSSETNGQVKLTKSFSPEINLYIMQCYLTIEAK
jgi:hypothetical protein